MLFAESNPIQAADRLTVVESSLSTPLVGGNIQTFNSAATTVTLNTAQVLSDMLLILGGTTLTATLPTAAQLVAAIPGVFVNSAIRFMIRNGNSGTLTVAVGTGITSATGNTLTVATVHAKGLFIQFTNVTPGSEACTLYTTYDTAY